MSSDVFRIVFYDFTLGYDASYDSCSYHPVRPGHLPNRVREKKDFPF